MKSAARTIARILVPLLLTGLALFSLQIAIGNFWAAGSTMVSADKPVYLRYAYSFCFAAPCLFVLAGFAIYWLRPPPYSPWACRRCGYDCTGMPSTARCPECGTQLV